MLHAKGKNMLEIRKFGYALILFLFLFFVAGKADDCKPFFHHFQICFFTL
jgi:hypothetical protein